MISKQKPHLFRFEQFFFFMYSCHELYFFSRSIIQGEKKPSTTNVLRLLELPNPYVFRQVYILVIYHAIIWVSVLAIEITTKLTDHPLTGISCRAWLLSVRFKA